MGKERVIEPRKPTRWAADISAILNAAQGADRFPISVASIALDFSKQLFPKDPISLVHGDKLPGFDGALMRAPNGGSGWGIVYNNAITSKGRINFTLAHEFGHYLIHRTAYPNGMRCGQQDMVRWDSTYRQVEHQANEFAAYLLMPFDDYRRQIDARLVVTFDLLSHCADRYEVSLIAATLRWLSYTERRAILVVSRDGFVLWARSSEPAFKSRLFIRTSSGPPVPVPATSIAARPNSFPDAKAGVNHDAGVWFMEPCHEMSIVSENYDFTLSLLQFSSSNGYRPTDEDEGTDTENLSDQIRRNHGL
jgi:hypothetical protein